jgi:hypothetical protein
MFKGCILPDSITVEFKNFAGHMCSSGILVECQTGLNVYKQDVPEKIYNASFL